MKHEIELITDKKVNLSDYLIFFEKLDDYRNRTISGIVFVCKDECISIKDFDKILNESKEVLNIFYKSILFSSGSPVIEKTNTNVFITFHESENITFVKISEINPVNQE